VTRQPWTDTGQLITTGRLQGVNGGKNPPVSKRRKKALKTAQNRKKIRESWQGDDNTHMRKKNSSSSRNILCTFSACPSPCPPPCLVIGAMARHKKVPNNEPDSGQKAALV